MPPEAFSSLLDYNCITSGLYSVEYSALCKRAVLKSPGHIWGLHGSILACACSLQHWPCTLTSSHRSFLISYSKVWFGAVNLRFQRAKTDNRTTQECFSVLWSVVCACDCLLCFWKIKSDTSFYICARMQLKCNCVNAVTRILIKVIN